QADVVAGAADQRAVPADHVPLLAAVVRAPQRTLVVGRDQGVDALGVGRRDGDIGLAVRGLRQAVVQLRPGDAVVVRDVDAAAGTVAVLRPGTLRDLPGAGNQGIGVGRIHAQAGAAGVRVDEQRALPGLAAVGGAEHAALLLRARGPADGADEHVVR